MGAVIEMLPRLTTVCLQITNTGDKLNERDWSGLLASVQSNVVVMFAYEIMFCGSGNPILSGQNACWIFTLPKKHLLDLRDELIHTQKLVPETTITVLTGKTEKLAPE